MISLKRYLDSAEASAPAGLESSGDGGGDLAALTAAYRATLQEMGSCGAHVCPPSGVQLQQRLSAVEMSLTGIPDAKLLAKTEDTVRTALRAWTEQTSEHFQVKAREVKELLLSLARTAQSVGERDDRCAVQMNRVTERLKNIASLDDVTEIRASIEESATELKASIDRMTTAGKAAMDELRAEITTYRARLDEAEYLASRDMLTGLGNRPWAEAQIEERIRAQTHFCAVMIDIDDFKRVNDEHGHMAGDELLKQFAGELRSACRKGDAACRWGGDEFVVLMDCELDQAEVQASRLQEWVCGNYSLQSRSVPLTLRIQASIGLAAHVSAETGKQLLDRADSAMYRNKAQSRQPARGN